MINLSRPREVFGRPNLVTWKAGVGMQTEFVKQRPLAFLKQSAALHPSPTLSGESKEHLKKNVGNVFLWL